MARDRKQEWLLSAGGLHLCFRLAGFFGISYFDQMQNLVVCDSSHDSRGHQWPSEHRHHSDRNQS